MTQKQQSTEQKHQTSKPQRTPSSEGSAALQQAHPIQELQGKIGNAQIARTLGEEALWALPEVGMKGGPVSNQLAGLIYQSLGGGRPLAHGMQNTLEATFGMPLDQVSIHDDAEADALSLSVSASAFTLGSDIFFSHLADPSDERLLRHEVAHVIQQASMSTAGPLTVGNANDALEHQAEAAASAGTAGAGTTSAGPSGTGATVQRGWLEDAYGVASNVAGVVGTGSSLVMEAARGTAAAGVSPAGDFLARGAGSGVQGLGNWLGPVGLVTGALGFGTGVDQMLNSPTFGDRLTGGTDALFSGLGAFSGGVGTAALMGLGTASLAPAAAVAGAAAGGYGLGRLLDEGVGSLGQAITGDDQGDYTISGGIADRMTTMDQAVSSIFADPDEPAYTQTLGWKLAEWLD
ncbi:MAG: DUF4157 domain-containing protein [Anaerolineae bacterium]|nr:DUF4157 domain-containing protein [Anaerolineae bacterium]